MPLGGGIVIGTSAGFPVVTFRPYPKRPWSPRPNCKHQDKSDVFCMTALKTTWIQVKRELEIESFAHLGFLIEFQHSEKCTAERKRSIY